MTNANVLLLAAGRFDASLAERIAAGREPRLDMFELRDALGATLLDFRALDSAPAMVRAVRRAAGDSAALAMLAIQTQPQASAYFTTGEDIGIPLALLMRARGLRQPHVMIAHTLAAKKKRPRSASRMARNTPTGEESPTPGGLANGVGKGRPCRPLTK